MVDAIGSGNSNAYLYAVSSQTPNQPTSGIFQQQASNQVQGNCNPCTGCGRCGKTTGADKDGDSGKLKSPIDIKA